MVNSVGEAFAPPVRAKPAAVVQPPAAQRETLPRGPEHRAEAPKEPHRGRHVDISA